MRDYEEGLSFVEGVMSSEHFTPNKYLSIHTHHWTSGIGLPRYLPTECRLLHTPHLLALEKASHNGIPCPSKVSYAETALFSRATAIFSLSRAESNTLRNGYGVPTTKIIETPNGVDSVFFSIPPLCSDQRRTFSLVSVGRICRQKGIDILLDAMEHLLTEDIPVELKLVGGSYNERAYEEEIIARLACPPLCGRVSWVGQVPHSQIPTLLSQCDVYVQPSRYESQGIALLEAMASGRAVVASDLPAIREYLSPEKNGILFPCENSEALAKALVRLYRAPALAEELARVGRTRAAQFTWEKLFNRTLPLLVGDER
jgi:Glycosyltransferase